MKKPTNKKDILYTLTEIKKELGEIEEMLDLVNRTDWEWYENHLEKITVLETAFAQFEQIVEEEKEKEASVTPLYNRDWKVEWNQ